MAKRPYIDEDTGGYEEVDDKPKGTRSTEGAGPRLLLQQYHDWLDEHWAFRLNVLTGTNEFSEKDADGNPTHWQTLEDADLNTIAILGQYEGWRFKQTAVMEYITSKLRAVEQYHPIRAYFDTLRNNPKIPKTGTKFIDMLAATVTVRAGQEKAWPILLKRWLVCSVAQSLNRGKNHQCLVLHGGQGIGKSTWLEALFPPALLEYCMTGHVEPSVKDPSTATYLTEKFVINIDDQLDTLLGKDFTAIKSLFTAPDATFRKSYARLTKKRLRTANFVASVNTEDFLTDSDNRRYICFTAEKIDYKHQVPIDYVWAEALRLFEGGKEPSYLNVAEKELQTEINNEYAQSTVEAALLAAHFEPAKPRDPGSYNYEPSELLLELQKKAPNTKLWPRNLATALKRYGFVKHKERLPKHNNQPRDVWVVFPKWDADKPKPESGLDKMQ